MGVLGMSQLEWNTLLSESNVAIGVPWLYPTEVNALEVRAKGARYARCIDTFPIHLLTFFESRDGL
jgi:hypothetical protein